MIITENNKTNEYYVTFNVQHKTSNNSFISSLIISLEDVVNKVPTKLAKGQFVLNLKDYLEQLYDNDFYVSIINYWFLKE